MKIITKENSIDLKSYDVIILSSGVYGGRPHAGLVRWLENIQKDDIADNTAFYIFMTWIGRGKSDRSAVDVINHILQKTGNKLEPDYISCYGKGMGFIRSGHPNQADREKVLQRVRNI